VEATAGKHNAITDVPGVLVGQVQSTTPPYLTGTTVVYLPAMGIAGVEVRGGAPGTMETDPLSPVNSNRGVNAIVLTGGSAFGLATAHGVMSWLEERHEGVRVGPEPHEVVPIVPAAVIFDLGRGGSFTARPEQDWGRRAIADATAGPIAQGNVGAGTGARASSLKGGVGTASTVLRGLRGLPGLPGLPDLPDGITVGALVVVNAFGSATDADGRLLSAAYGLDGEFPALRTPTEPPPPVPEMPRPVMNTVIAVVATDAPLDKTALTRMAMVAHDGIARAIDPAHTLLDGDTIFAVSTSPPDAPRWRVTDFERLADVEAVCATAARTLTRAIGHAMLAAESFGDLPSYRDAYPSALG
jgi:L-aminopeptidase/D-esterase-like protein